jgi:hypothetical protein
MSPLRNARCPSAMRDGACPDGSRGCGRGGAPLRSSLPDCRARVTCASRARISCDPTCATRSPRPACARYERRSPRTWRRAAHAPRR